MFGETNPAVATAMGVAIGLALFLAAIGLVFLMVEVSRWLVRPTPAMHPVGTQATVPMMLTTRCSCGATAKRGKTQCGPCARGERIVAPLGGEPVGGG